MMGIDLSKTRYPSLGGFGRMKTPFLFTAVRWFIVAVIVAIATLIIVQVSSNGCPSAEAEAFKNCKSGCLSYSAEYSLLKPVGGGYTTTTYECWCRRGNEPLRIW